MKTEIILCDLGRTLIDFDHRLAAKNILPVLKQRASGLKQMLLNEVTLFAFLFAPTKNGATRNQMLERGHADIEWLCREFESFFGIPLSPAEMTPVWNEMFTTTADDTFDAMERARQRGLRVAICSNTNASHWDFLLERYPRLRGLADEPFLSFEMGMVKTDPGFFPEILRCTGRPPEAHLFVDDLEENLAAARAVGIPGLLFHGKLPPHEAWQHGD
ncbi:MAG: hypothetical protein KF858_06900 [Candidatus Sumerlaeia bacterium]|nr:hypothetical protein [Candidatus Sumerlaeia bacterium]